MTTHSDELREDGERLLAQVSQIAAALLEEPADRDAFAGAMATALEQAETIAAAAVDPRRVLPAGTAVQLLLLASTRTDSPAMATALVEAARAHTVVWWQQAERARFRAQLDGGGPPWDAWGVSGPSEG